jgi:hypothetical protein
MSVTPLATEYMILQGGPLDGEHQIIAGVVDVGETMTFNLDTFQHFAADGVTVLQQGLIATYQVTGPGPAPVPPGDTWTVSWYLGFVSAVYTTPVPPNVVVPTPPQLSPSVWMGAGTFMGISGDPSPGVALEGDTSLTVDGVDTAWDFGSIVMTGETVLTVIEVDWSTYQVALTASAGMNINAAEGVPINILSAQDSSFESAGTGDWAANTNCTIANSTAQAQQGTHSLAITSVAAGAMFALMNTPVQGGFTYQASAYFRPATTARTVAISMEWFDAFNNNLGISQTTYSEVAGNWVWAISVGTAPPTATSVSLLLYVSGTGAAGETHYADNISLGITPS